MNSGQKISPSPTSAMLEQVTRKTQGQEGWALLGLMLALAILSIVLVSSVTPNYQLSVQREKEAELMYRGQQMAEGIALYYNLGVQLGPINLQSPPPYGYLKELKKLSEGVKLGVRDIKFVRPSAMIDPMSSEEWEPVYARDPRILPFLQAWAAETGGIISPQYMLLASAPIKTHKVSLPTTPSSETTQTSPSSGSSQQSGVQQGGTQQGGTTGGNPGRPGAQKRPNTGDSDDDDDYDDDDDDDSTTPNDPLASLFQQGSFANPPIVGVAPKRKGVAVRPYFGLKNYEEWVFLYVPPTVVRQPIPNPNQNQNPNQQQNGQPPTRYNP
jgi:type II secretory pathway pseudopilin PulG